ncbi:hypothetical protein B0H34DRAFT_298148 [Crassisporium funariophilum]|nr:hypothetical protein B0H34DRAFT_298148 [Crassisporium funariophilum]
MDDIFLPATLPCGRTVENRLVKVAMYEHLASFNGGPPNSYHHDLYSEWAKHGWGIIVTGNVQISSRHLSLGRDIIIPERLTDESLAPFKKLAACIHGLRPREDGTSAASANGTLAIMQLNHPGRQSSNFIGGRAPFQPPMGPSPVRVGSGSDTGLMTSMVHSIMFQTPRTMTSSDIDEMVQDFVRGAQTAYRSGFDGIQLHAAHGYLLAQFLSPKSNKRTDRYSVDNALELIHDIVSLIRSAVPKDFILSIKLNAADYSDAGPSKESPLSQTETRALNHILTMASWGSIDIIEISGGDYEKPDFMNAGPSSKSHRQAFFARFSHQALRALDSLPRDASSPPMPLILLTGGLRTPSLLRSAIVSRHADLLGIGRGSVLCPDLPSVLRKRNGNPAQWDDVPFQQEPDLNMPLILDYWPVSWAWGRVPKIKLIGAGVSMAWYVVAIRHLANTAVDGAAYNVVTETGRGALGSLLQMWAWTPRRCADSHWHRTSYYWLFSVILAITVAAFVYPF